MTEQLRYGHAVKIVQSLRDDVTARPFQRPSARSVSASAGKTRTHGISRTRSLFDIPLASLGVFMADVVQQAAMELPDIERVHKTAACVLPNPFGILRITARMVGASSDPRYE
jgi:hypothetical protein